MTDNKLFLDIHVIQTVPPSNINRDDTGSPKTAQYGGVTRARVSSQSWKKAVRDYFNEKDPDIASIRTKRVVKAVFDASKKVDKSMEEIQKFLDGIKYKVGTNNVQPLASDPDYKRNSLIFLSEKEIEKITEKYDLGTKITKEEIKLIFGGSNFKQIDIPLFGRMVADDPSLNADASAQVAHAISTHAVQTEFDFFTATDDLAPEDNAGAGMLGTVEYNSSTLYRYANVATHELNTQLGDKDTTVKALKLFVEAFVNSMPTGKANTFANQTLPSAVVVELRDDRPVNVVNAFEEPVKSSNGYVRGSIEKLEQELNEVKKFVNEPVKQLSIGLSDHNESNLNGLLETLGQKLEEKL